MAGEAEFQPGDIVRLKSGGPTMIVLATAGANRAPCAWWNPKTQKLNQDYFPTIALEKAEGPDAFPALPA